MKMTMDTGILRGNGGEGSQMILRTMKLEYASWKRSLPALLVGYVVFNLSALLLLACWIGFLSGK